MAYVSSSAPLPTNSLTPGPSAVDMAQRWRDFQASQEGRERVYANIPTAASLWDVAPGLAVDASQILGQSEQARQSVLTGLELPTALQDAYSRQEQTLAEIQAQAPVVSSLNGNPSVPAGLDTTQASVVPAPAPQKTVGGLYGSAKLPSSSTGKSQSEVTGLVTSRTNRKYPQVSPHDLGPGCMRGPLPQFASGSFGPDWGQSASLPSGERPEASSWIIVAAGAAAIFAAGFLGKKGGFR